MDTTTAIVLIAAVVVVGLVAWMVLRQRRTVMLRRHYGPEYDRLASRQGTGRAEAELVERSKRVEQLSIRPLAPERRHRFTERWKQQQARFVDEPKAAIDDADHLVEEVMRERGYPVGEFEQRVADISVDHPRVVQNYRAAHDIALRERGGKASTEDLRQAMIYYRELFMDLLEEPLPKGATSR